MIINPPNSEELVLFLKSKPLILYGMGDTGIRISKWCDEQNVDYMFADKNVLELRKTSLKRIISPEDVVHEYSDSNIVVSSIVYNEEITEDLLRLGIQKERIFHYSLFMPDEVSWKDLEDNRLTDWKLMRNRFKMLSEWGWIPNDVNTVADYGAGQKFIKEYLPVSVKYYPIDYTDRGEDTIICDFNTGIFPDIHAELSVCTGVLMYIDPTDKLITHICEHTSNCVIFSYITLEGFSGIGARRRSSICNDLTEQQIMDMFASCNFKLKDKKEDAAGNTVMSFYMFEKGDSAVSY